VGTIQRDQAAVIRKAAKELNKAKAAGRELDDAALDEIINTQLEAKWGERAEAIWAIYKASPERLQRIVDMFDEE
jgi:methionine synthase II (cobalamin-independent)